MGERTADGAGKSEARVQGDAGQLLGLLRLDALLDGVQLDAAGRGRGRVGGHCVCGYLGDERGALDDGAERW